MKSLEERRKYLKSISIKILNGHTAPNLKDTFCPNNERDNTYNLRNRGTDLAPWPLLVIIVRCIGIIFPMSLKFAKSKSSFKSILKRTSG